MSRQNQDDNGAYLQAPLIYILRNVCAPAFAKLFVREFEKAKYVCNNPKEVSDQTLTLYELLKKINHKGKREEEKRRKKQANAQMSTTVSRTLHINNLNDNKDTLMQINVKDLLKGKNSSQIENRLLEIDMLFLLNLLTNQILGYQIDLSSLDTVRNIRNIICHSGTDVGDWEENLNNLCRAMKTVYNDLNLHDDLEQKKREALNFQNTFESTYLQFIGDLKKEVISKYPLNKLPAVFPDVIDTRCLEDSALDVKNHFLSHGTLAQRERHPILLSGFTGSGKTTILQAVAAYSNQEDSSFLLSIYVKLEGNPNQENFWIDIVQNIEHQYPETIRRNDYVRIEDVLMLYRQNILFLIDSNIKSLHNGYLKHMARGAWVVTVCSVDAQSSDFHTLKVKPLNEALARNLILSLNSDKESLKVLKLYDECEYKGLLDTPEMICLFSDLRKKVKCSEIVQYYIQKKMEAQKIPTDEQKVFEELAFQEIIKNKKKEEENPSTCIKDLFRYMIIEDFFAAKYIVHNEEKAEAMLKERPTQLPFFKRAFRFACLLWSENKCIKMKEKFILFYLKALFAISKENEENGKCQHRKKIEKEKNGKRQHRKKIEKEEECEPKKKKTRFEDDFSTECYNNAFTKWSYLVSLAKICECNEVILKILAQIIAKKNTWLFKCKFLNEETVNTIGVILEHVKTNEQLIVKLESGEDARMLNMLLEKLGNLNHLRILLQINLRRHSNDCTSRGKNNGEAVQSLRELSKKISQISSNEIQLSKYVGSFVCTGKQSFLECPCVKNIEILDVCVRDMDSLAQILSCGRLEELIALEVRADIKYDEASGTNFKTITIPEDKPLKLTVKYSDRFQEYVNSIHQPENLKYMSMYGVHGTKIDLRRFVNLECLYIKCKPDLKQKQFVTKDQEQMDVDGNVSNLNHDQMLLPHEWAFQLAVNIQIPESLKRLMFRNCFVNDSNIISVLGCVKKIQRLMMLDTKVTIFGAKQVILGMVEENRNSQSQDDEKHFCKNFKRHCLVKSESRDKGKCSKAYRLSKQEIENRRKYKPEGKELIISSLLSLCGKCSNFPCSCNPRQDTVVGMIDLIEATYQCNLVSCCYFSKIITVKKNVAGDLRVRIPLQSLDDYMVNNLESHKLYDLIKAFHLAQYITLEQTRLTLHGVQEFVGKLKKVRDTSDPFTLIIYSREHPWSDAEVTNSSFIDFLKQEEKLSYFVFQCTCIDTCPSKISKTHSGNIFLNDTKLLHKQNIS